MEEINRCTDGKWSCRDGKRCIEEHYVCDSFLHCTDGSDEKPELCALWQCPTNMLKCPNNICLKAEFVCDKVTAGWCLGFDESDEVRVLTYVNCKHILDNISP